MTAGLLCCYVCENGRAQVLMLSGDANIIDALNNTSGPALDPGNQLFFQHVLGPGHTVLYLNGYLSSPFDSSARWVGTITNFYNGLPGVSASAFSGTVASSNLAGVDLFIAPIPVDPFSSGETTALQNFLRTGGRVLFLGENGNFAPQNLYINNALLALGSTMRIVSASEVDPGYHVATGSQIAADPFTAGISTFTYAAASEISGGNQLFFGTCGQPFLAYEMVPEPSAILFGVLGIVAFLWSRRQQRS